VAKEAILVRDRVITEGAHSNVCAVFDGVLFTHPATHRILAGITRGLVLELCAERGIPYREEAIGLDALAEASEVMIVGTTTEIMPVISVDGRPVADGRPGPVTRRLQGAFRARVEAALH
jgi:D-alanine transaminase